jgi:hypothetical protein
LITITFVPYRRYRVEGHADYDVQGKDIVCSAISAMSQQTLTGLLEYSKTNYEISDGLLDVEYKANSCTDVLMYAFETYAKGLAERYPEHIEVLYIYE